LASVNSGVPVQALFEYRLNVTVPVGLYPPDTVAWSEIDWPTVVELGAAVLDTDGDAALTVTGSAEHELVTLALFESPL